MQPELLTKSEYIAAQTAIDLQAGLEQTGSIHWTGLLEEAHLYWVRKAVAGHHNIHVENRIDYKHLIPGLRRYSANGNLAVFDTSKPVLTDAQNAREYSKAVAFSEQQERKKALRSESINRR